jgi:hypothetical protein
MGFFKALSGLSWCCFCMTKSADIPDACVLVMTGCFAMASWPESPGNPADQAFDLIVERWQMLLASDRIRIGPTLKPRRNAEICLNQRTFPSAVLSEVPCRPIKSGT